jgi:hypothetical protein
MALSNSNPIFVQNMLVGISFLLIDMKVVTCNITSIKLVYARCLIIHLMANRSVSKMDVNIVQVTNCLNCRVL